MKYFEANFDGLVGPTHNYAGLSVGNVASLSNAKDVSNPKAAALQGLQKMKALHDMGLKQGVLAPQERPDLNALRRLGFSGSDANILQQAAKQAPQVLRAVYSASSMWTANAATVSPSSDTADKKVHFTPANLTNKFHRSLEPETSGRILKAMFASEEHFAHHKHLPDNDHFGDEGAANHTRFSDDYGRGGVEMFVYGRYAFDANKPAPVKFPARHTFEACQAVARLHQLDDSSVVYVQQNPDVIDQGVFHNDVIAVGNEQMLFCHEQAFLKQQQALESIGTAYNKLTDETLTITQVMSKEVSVADAISSYLFNSQLLTTTDGNTALIAPSECQQNPNVHRYLEQLIASQTLHTVHYMDLKQSMQNGGGPACLRLRVVLNEQEQQAVNPRCLMNHTLYDELCAWVNKHYRDTLQLNDLRDPNLISESFQALDELTQILEIGSIYDFQK